jgi:hypothetical protein
LEHLESYGNDRAKIMSLIFLKTLKAAKINVLISSHFSLTHQQKNMPSARACKKVRTFKREKLLRKLNSKRILQHQKKTIKQHSLKEARESHNRDDSENFRFASTQPVLNDILTPACTHTHPFR